MFFVTRKLMHFRPKVTVGVLEQCLSQPCTLDVILSSPHLSDGILVSAMTVLFDLK